MERLKPFGFLRRCWSESSLNSCVHGAHNPPNDNYFGPPNADHTGGGESDMNLGFPIYGNMVDSYIVLARRMAAGQSLNVDSPESCSSSTSLAAGESLNVDVLESSSSSRSLAGTATVLLLPYAVTHFIVFWRNGVTLNNSVLIDLDDPFCDNLFLTLRNNYMPKDLIPSIGGYVRIKCILRNENHPADPERLLSIDFDETRPTTILQLKFSDHTQEDVSFNLHHTVADIRAYFDASRPHEDELYYLLVLIPPRGYWELYNPDQTIQQAGLIFSIIEQRRY